jgi:tetratricopeptide (TPR) repeat protein
MAAMIINGVLNNPLQGSTAAALGGALLFLPLAVVIAAARLDNEATPSPAPARRPARRALLAAAGLAAVVALAALAAWRPLGAAVYANLGAVEQTRVELGIHDLFDGTTPSLDEARRMADLSRAMAYFEAAVRLDPGNSAARQRLGQIALSRGEYALALAHAEAAWAAGHRDALTRMTLGDAYVAAGRVSEAAGVARGVSQSNRRFAGQGWYRYMVGQDFERAAYAYAAAYAVDPTDAESARMQAEAERSAQAAQQTENSP